MALLKHSHTYFAIHDGISTVRVQSNALRLKVNDGSGVSGPVTPGTWAVTQVFSLVDFSDLTTHIHSVVEDPTDLQSQTLLLSFKPSLFDAMHPIGPDTKLQVQVTNTPYGQSNVEIRLRTLSPLDFMHVLGGDQASFQVDHPSPLQGDILTGFVEGEYFWEVDPPSGALAGLGLDINASALGQTASLAVSGTPTTWPALIDDAPFTLTVTSGAGTIDQVSRAEFSFVPATSTDGPRLTLRSTEATPGIPVTGYTAFEAQTSGGPGLSDPIVGLSASIANVSPGLPLGLALSFADDLALTGLSATDPILYDEIGTFDLSLTLGTRPACTLPARALELRRPEAPSAFPVALPFDVVMGSHDFVFNGLGDWTWGAFTSSGSLAGLVTGTGTGGSSGLSFRLDWNAFALDPGLSDTFSASVQRSDLTHPVSNLSFDVEVQLPSMGEIFVSSSGSGIDANLHTAREKLRWRDHVYLRKADGTALDEPTVDQQVEYYLQEPSGLEFDVEVKSLSIGTPDLVENRLQTELSGLNQFVPSGWAALSPRTVKVRALLRDTVSGAVLAGGNENELSLVVEPTLENLNVAVVLDRSGSMKRDDRWEGAVSGAHWFADEVQSMTVGHKIAVLWFAAKGGGLSYPASGSAPYGVLEVGGDSLDFSDFTADPALFLTTLEAAETGITPGGATSIGAGLMHARDKLHAEDPGGAAAQRIALVLSDGRENRPPSLESPSPQIFEDGLWEAASEGTPAGDPNTRILAGAVGTTADWADVLRTAADKSGGIGELDVKHMPDASMATMVIGAWFAGNLANLFNYSPVAAPSDPTIQAGETHTYDAEITHANSKIIFTLFMGGKPNEASDWALQVQPPGETSILDEAFIEASPGMRLVHGPMYRKVVIDLPLAIAGHEHRWAGTWKFHIQNSSTQPMDYLPSILAAGDSVVKVVLDAPADIQSGNWVTVRAFVGEVDDSIEQIQARATIHPPGPWIGELYGALASDAASARNDSGDDTGEDEDEDRPTPLEQGAELVGELLADEPPPPSFEIELVQVDAHTFEGRFLADHPGTWSIDTDIDGLWSPADLAAAATKQQQRRERLFETRSGQDLEDALAALETAGFVHQGFHIEDRKSLGVSFKVDADQSDRHGSAITPGKIRLSVTPRDIDGEQLGPGWASRLRFFAGEGREGQWAATDGGGGSYFVDIEVTGERVRICERQIVGESLRLSVGGKGFNAPLGRLDLDSFGVHAMGTSISIPVRGRVCPRDPEDPRPDEEENVDCVPELLRDCWCELKSISKADAEILCDLLKVLAPALGKNLPAHKGSYAHWHFALKTSLVATTRAIDKCCDDNLIECLKVYAEALARVLRWLRELPRASFGGRRGDATLMRALVHATQNLAACCAKLGVDPKRS